MTSTSTSKRTRATPARLVGLDAARGVAIIGMISAHLYASPQFQWGNPATWLDLANGRSSALFAVLVGITLSIMTGRPVPYEGVPALQARVRIITRALVLVVVHFLLVVARTEVMIILVFIASWLVMALPFVRWPASRLFVLAATVAIVGPLARILVLDAMGRVGLEPWNDDIIQQLFLTGGYPAIPWLAYVFTGLGLAKLRLEDLRVQWYLVGAGCALMATGYGISTALVGFEPLSRYELPPAIATAPADGVEVMALPLPDLSSLLEAGAHSGTPFELVGATGYALTIIGIASLAVRRWQGLLFPLIATGSMALTIYCAHVAWMWLQPSLLNDAGPGSFVLVTVSALLFASIWKATLGQGPLERFMKWVTVRAARLPAAQITGSGAAN